LAYYCPHSFERLEWHEGQLFRAVLRGGDDGNVTPLPSAWKDGRQSTALCPDPLGRKPAFVSDLGQFLTVRHKVRETALVRGTKEKESKRRPAMQTRYGDVAVTLAEHIATVEECIKNR
jgi:hypothetical protein